MSDPAEPALRTAEDVIEQLRSVDHPPHLFRGFGPLALAAALVLVMILLAPSVAPERIVERPVDATDEVEP